MTAPRSRETAARGRRRARATVGLAALALALSCSAGGFRERDGHAPDASSAPGPDAPRAAILRVGTSGDYPPFSILADLDSHALAPVRGFDVELAARIARDLALGIEWVPFRWPELAARVAADEFDVVASGVTWRPERAVSGWMTRTTAVGGPCVVGDPAPARVAVNHGGVLERFARARFAGAEILALDDNRALGRALTRRRADAIVTDSFERPHLDLPTETPFACEAKTDRKVLWLAPARAAELGPQLDAWLASHEDEIDELRVRWLGGSAPRTGTDHLLDLLARRLAYMPAVAAWKRAHGVTIEDAAREVAVLDAARQEAQRAGLEPAAVAALFALQIELSKRAQADAVEAPDAAARPALDLGGQIRPELVRLGARIVAAAARVAPLDATTLDAADWAPLDAGLRPDERRRLRAALLAIEPSARRGATDD
ncbi:transporter substrate-binding domain-containing protein [Myxococcota bacterium]|nr:transporter substrate-binding domain-containing protein [Myxococcota bacterium]MCZ7620380.1 transporter substrate-binding domain-containing protein [Myxococcota bacterium]